MPAQPASSGRRFPALSSHLLGEIEQVCDRVGILDRGRLLAVGSTGELHQVGDRVSVNLRPEDEAAAMSLLAAHGVQREAPERLVVRAPCGREVNRRLAIGGVFAESIAPPAFRAGGALSRDHAGRPAVMRLLRAELTKLGRPLLLCIAVALVVFAVPMGWVGAQRLQLLRLGGKRSYGVVPPSHQAGLCGLVGFLVSP
jgi:hypothetical protein